MDIADLLHRASSFKQKIGDARRSVSPDAFEWYPHDTLSALCRGERLGMIRLAFAVRFLAVAGFGLENRQAWGDLVRERPQWATSLLEDPLLELGGRDWRDPLITAVEHLAGSVVADHLNRPLHVNRFRQMAGVEI